MYLYSVGALEIKITCKSPKPPPPAFRSSSEASIASPVYQRSPCSDFGPASLGSKDIQHVQSSSHIAQYNVEVLFGNAIGERRESSSIHRSVIAVESQPGPDRGPTSPSCRLLLSRKFIEPSACSGCWFESFPLISLARIAEVELSGFQVSLGSLRNKKLATSH
jgi:hypothetical protein